MKRFASALKFSTSIALILISGPLLAQEVSAVENDLLDFEKKIEKAVVDTNIPFLEKAYAIDFRFKHGTGLVDSKTSWLKSVEKAKGQYVSRLVDSVEVEIHNTIGITNGKITVTRLREATAGEARKPDQAQKKYMIRYVRVYVKMKDQWQLIMHRTVFEKDY